MRVRLVDVACALAFTAAVTALAVTVWYEPPAPDPAQPVARVTTSDLEVIADLLRTLDRRPGLSPAEAATVERVAEAVEAIDAGVVEVIPAADPLPPPTATTTTTTTTAPPPTTTEANSPQNPVGHPNVNAPPVTLPPQVPFDD